MKNHNCEHMLLEAQNVLPSAYAPYSNFTVACCIETKTGNYYTGVNVENASYSLTLCAESSAIAKMISAGEHHIQSLLILGGNHALCPPCGACRQRIYEFADKETRIYLCEESKVTKTLTIAELLPLAFDL